MSRINKSVEVGTRKRAEWEVTANGCGICFGGDENVLKLDCSSDYIQKAFKLYSSSRSIMSYMSSILKLF